MHRQPGLPRAVRLLPPFKAAHPHHPVFLLLQQASPFQLCVCYPEVFLGLSKVPGGLNPLRLISF